MIAATRAVPKRAQDPILGTVLYCPDCKLRGGALPFSVADAYWPADTEFFNRTGTQNRRGRFHSYCKACFSERRRSYLNRPLPAYLLEQEPTP
jgi:hypothetical protein